MESIYKCDTVIHHLFHSSPLSAIVMHTSLIETKDILNVTDSLYIAKQIKTLSYMPEHKMSSFANFETPKSRGRLIHR